VLVGQLWPGRLSTLTQGRGTPPTQDDNFSPQNTASSPTRHRPEPNVVFRGGYWSPASDTSCIVGETINGLCDMVDAPQHGNPDRNFARLSISSASTTSSGASSMVSRAMSCSSPESCNDSSPPFVYTPLPTPTTEHPVTKIEELDDDADQLMNAPPLPIENGEVPAKRGRGRPRKHPVPPLKTAQKVTKGRSKTGCITCRRRKKKCDETKPECMLYLSRWLWPG